MKHPFKKGDWLINELNYSTYWYVGKRFQAADIWLSNRAGEYFVEPKDDSGSNIFLKTCRKAKIHELPFVKLEYLIDEKLYN